jgi:hypothetical protein
MNTSEPLALLQFGLCVPVSAVNLALRCESIGIVLSIASDGRLAAKTQDGAPIPDDIRSELSRLKGQILLLLRYTPSDLHLRQENVAAPELGPITAVKPEVSK